MLHHPDDVVKVIINNVDTKVGGVFCLVGSRVKLKCNQMLDSLQAFKSHVDDYYLNQTGPKDH